MQESIKERPILFSSPMVRALLDGSKTQTRRAFSDSTKFAFDCAARIGEVSFFLEQNELGKNDLGYVLDFCPCGKVGDRLWVRETFQPVFADGFDHDSNPYPNYKTGYGYAVTYPATDEIVEWIDGDDNITSRCRPSIHMPRWASRINLEITGVRVERLNDISEADAKAEGAPSYEEGIDAPPPSDGEYSWSYCASFKTLWESIKGAGSWQENPWVWVVEFKVVK